MVSERLAHSSSRRNSNKNVDTQALYGNALSNKPRIFFKKLRRSSKTNDSDSASDEDVNHTSPARDVNARITDDDADVMTADHDRDRYCNMNNAYLHNKTIHTPINFERYDTMSNDDNDVFNSDSAASDSSDRKRKKFTRLRNERLNKRIKSRWYED